MSDTTPATGLQRIKVKAPNGINLGNKAQVDKLIAVVEKQHGTGWKLASVDEENREVHLARVSEVVSVKQSESRKDSFDVSLPREYKASDAERASAELESNPSYAGYVMTDFNPFLHIATLTRLSKEEIVARGYLAQTLGVKPWDIQVQATAAGGYTVKLPRQYVPAKHDDKLTEVVETAVGAPGWYIKFNPKERTAEIVPGDLPTFAAMIPFPLQKALKSGDNVMQFGECLGANSNSPGGPAVIDFDSAAHSLLSGTSGSGKTVTINAMIAWQLLTGHELVVIDLPHKAVDFTWCRDYVRDGGWGCDSLEASVAALEMVYREGMERAKVLKEHDVTKVDELPKHLRMKPIFVVVDELSGLLILEEVPRGLPKDSPMVVEANRINLLKQTLLNRIKKIAAELRFVKIRLLLSSQVSSTDTGVPTSLRMNLANKMLQGTNPTDNNRRLALSDALSVPKVPTHVREDPKVGKGVGVAELEGKTPTVYKGYYAPVSDYKKAIEARGVKKTTRPAPTPTEIARFTPSIDEEDAQKGFGHKPRALEPWEVGPDGKPLTGFERANAAKHAATVGARG
jgi:hypothetical protein